jgi:hypothetical protein
MRVVEIDQQGHEVRKDFVDFVRPMTTTGSSIDFLDGRHGTAHQHTPNRPHAQSYLSRSRRRFQQRILGLEQGIHDRLHVRFLTRVRSKGEMNLHAVERQRCGGRKWTDLVPPVPGLCRGRCASSSSSGTISSTSSHTLGDGFHMTRMNGNESASRCMATPSWTMMRNAVEVDAALENCPRLIIIIRFLAGRSRSVTSFATPNTTE